MWYPATVMQPPEAEPVTLDEVKAQLRITFDDDDALLGRLITAARDHVEKYCGTTLATQTIALRCDGFHDFARLPVAPVQSVASVKYIDTDGQENTLPTDTYELRADGLEASIARRYGQHWPAIQRGSRITVTAVAGYSSVPPAVRHAMLLFIAEAYENRENAPQGGWSAMDSLLSNYRHFA